MILVPCSQYNSDLTLKFGHVVTAQDGLLPQLQVPNPTQTPNGLARAVWFIPCRTPTKGAITSPKDDRDCIALIWTSEPITFNEAEHDKRQEC